MASIKYDDGDEFPKIPLNMANSDQTNNPLEDPDMGSSNPEQDPQQPEEPGTEQIDKTLDRLALLAETDPAQMEKLERIKKQIKDGTYYVSPEDLARSILEDIDRIKARTKDKQ